MSYISQIIKTEYLWDNRVTVEDRCRELGIPVDEDDVIEEWRDIVLNVNLVAFFTAVSYMDGDDQLTLPMVTMNLSGCPSFLINIDYDEFAELLSAAICDRESMHKSTIKLNEDNKEQVVQGNP